MKQIISLLVVLTIYAAAPLYAGDAPAETPWNEVCKKTADHEVIVKTTTGDTIDGYCIAVNVNEVSINVQGKFVKVARTSVDRLTMLPKYPMKSLGHGLHEGLHFGLGHLLTPLGPIAVVTIGGTLAWGAIAMPFCAIGELKARLEGDKEIKLK